MLHIFTTCISLINVLVSAGRNESWLYDMNANEVIICDVKNPLCPKNTKYAQDGQAMLAFLVNNYERLHTLRVAFVHGGKNEWHSIKDIETRIKTGWSSNNFIHFGNPSRRVCIDIATTGWCSNILKPQNVTCNLYLCTYQGLQFMTSGREFMKQATLNQYKGMEQTCNGLDHPPREFGKSYKGCSYAMEYLGQYFAGGHLQLPSLPRIEL